MFEQNPDVIKSIQSNLYQDFSEFSIIEQDKYDCSSKQFIDNNDSLLNDLMDIISIEPSNILPTDSQFDQYLQHLNKQSVNYFI